MPIAPDGENGSRLVDYDPPPPLFVTLPPMLLEKLTSAEQETYKARVVISTQLEWLVRNMVEIRVEQARLVKRYETMESTYKKIIGTMSVVGAVMVWLLGDKLKALLGLNK